MGIISSAMLHAWEEFDNCGSEKIEKLKEENKKLKEENKRLKEKIKEEKDV